MTKLAIKDLSVSEELGRKEMSEVRGGMGKFYMPPWMGYGKMVKKDVSFEGNQEINQLQDITAIAGTNFAAFDSVAKPNVTVNATQDADIRNRVGH